ncbi:MAG: 2-amino-4-hydroxy-6-hydroxymethyldihydropteridine diphosphokinase [Gammaproteobacteria bacterium]|nr:2-amino-4-hydroxy-6-hydroxymethyldihydropteridine diphosphokinase [Gammaproteobacteria bacterium]
MPQAVLSLGSNIDPAFNIRTAVTHLRTRYPDLLVSPVYESEAVGFTGDNFINLVVALKTDAGLAALIAELKQLEDQQGRDRTAPRFSGRTLDIDLLSFDGLQGVHAGLELPRPEIVEHAFVLRPLADLLPNSLHPSRQLPYSQLWEEFPKDEQRLWQIDFDWGEQSSQDKV